MWPVEPRTRQGLGGYKIRFLGEERSSQGHALSHRRGVLWRRFFKLSMTDLNVEREAKPALDSKFLEYRRDRVSGANQFKSDVVVDVARYTEKANVAFLAKYEEGTFTRIWEFARQRRLPFKALSCTIHDSTPWPRPVKLFNASAYLSLFVPISPCLVSLFVSSFSPY